MTLSGVIFYVLGATILLSTLLAITARLTVHSIAYLILSFFATGVLFYLLGAPFLAALEVIIYAGAIMVLFLFVVMTLPQGPEKGTIRETLKQWLPAIILSVISLSAAGVLILATPGSGANLNAATAAPSVFGRFIFDNYWFPVEIVSLLLLIGLVGALYLGGRQSSERERSEDGA